MILLYWYFMGVCYLIYHLYCNFNNKEANQQGDYVMLGLTISISSHISQPLLYTLLIILIEMFILWFMIYRLKEPLIANIIMWVSLGWLMIGSWEWLLMLFLTASIDLTVGIIKSRLGLKVPITSQLLMVLTASYIGTGLILIL
jgi:hypothetical protein